MKKVEVKETWGRVDNPTTLTVYYVTYAYSGGVHSMTLHKQEAIDYVKKLGPEYDWDEYELEVT